MSINRKKNMCTSPDVFCSWLFPYYHGLIELENQILDQPNFYLDNDNNRDGGVDRAYLISEFEHKIISNPLGMESTSLSSRKMKLSLIFILGVTAPHWTSGSELRHKNSLLDIDEGLLRAVTLTENTTNLDLSDLELQKIAENVFDNLTQIRHLNLSNNLLDELPPGLFYKLHNLETLSLAYNRISAFHGNFSGSDNLKTIDLSGSFIYVLRSGDFSGLTKATTVILKGSPITTLEPTVFGSSPGDDIADPYPESQRLRGEKEPEEDEGPINWISRIPRLKICKTDDGLVKSFRELENEPLGDCQRVKWLQPFDGGVDLRGLGIKAFQRGWYNLSTNWVDRIDFSNNEISEITPEFLNDLSPNMTVIHLSNNKIEVIKNNTIENRYIKKLFLGNNIISNIEDGAFEKTELQELALSNNRLKSLVFARSLPNTLRRLELDSNELSELPEDSLGNLEKLRYLPLQKNKITSLPASTLRGLKELREIDLSENRLKEIQPGAFQDQGNLRTLQLSSNQIRKLNPGVFKGLKKLRSLKLNFNLLKKIQQGSFSDLDNCVGLDIEAQYNGINRIEAGSFANLSLNELNLEHNLITEESISKGAFNGTYLLYLNLSDNWMTTINGDSFYGIVSRSYNLILIANRLKSIKKGAAKYLGNVHRLELSMNRLEFLENGALWGLPKLGGSSIDLDYRSIDFIQAGVFEDV